MPIIESNKYIHDSSRLPEKLTYNTVVFTDIDYPTVNVNSKIGNNNYILKDRNNHTIEISAPLINAIDIDWNGAQLTYTKDITINHSGDLLALVDSISYISYVSTYDIAYIQQRISNLPGEMDWGSYTYGNVKEEDVIKIIQSVQYPDSQVEGFTYENGLVTASQVRGPITTSIINELITNEDLHRAFDGKSAFEIARENGGPDFDTLYPNEAAWIASLNGKDGENGKSAYEIAAEIGGQEFADKYANEKDWIEHGLKVTIQLESGPGIDINTSENSEGEVKTISFNGFLRIQKVLE